MCAVIFETFLFYLFCKSSIRKAARRVIFNELVTSEVQDFVGLVSFSYFSFQHSGDFSPKMISQVSALTHVLHLEHILASPTGPMLSKYHAFQRNNLLSKPSYDVFPQMLSSQNVTAVRGFSILSPQPINSIRPAR